MTVYTKYNYPIWRILSLKPMKGKHVLVIAYTRRYAYGGVQIGGKDLCCLNL
jgi:hypothetical protein